MKKVFVSVSKGKKIEAIGAIYVSEVGEDRPSPEVLKDQLAENSKLYQLIGEEGTGIYKGITAIVALAMKGYKVSFKEYKEKQDGKC